MPKTFTKEQEKEIDEKLKEFAENHPDFELNHQLSASIFKNIIASSTVQEGEEKKARELLHIKELSADDKVLDAYKEYYKSVFSDCVKHICMSSINSVKDVEINIESFVELENFMREMFVTYVAPSLHENISLKNYCFGRMSEKDVEDVRKPYDNYTNEWMYKEEMRRGVHGAGGTYLEDLKHYMNVYPSDRIGKDTNKDEIACGAAVAYKCADEKYHSHWLITRILNPFTWKEAYDLRQGKNYIQSLRDDASKNGVSFEEFVSQSCKSPCVNMGQLDFLERTVRGFISDTKDSRDSDFDVMNNSSDVMKELYGDEDEKEKIVMDLLDEEDQKSHDFNDINNDIDEASLMKND